MFTWEKKHIFFNINLSKTIREKSLFPGFPECILRVKEKGLSDYSQFLSLGTIIFVTIELSVDYDEGALMHYCKWLVLLITY